MGSAHFRWLQGIFTVISPVEVANDTDTQRSPDSEMDQGILDAW